MLQTIGMLVLLVVAVVYVSRHFLKVYRTGNDPSCTGCSSSDCRGGKHPEEDHETTEGSGSCTKSKN